MAGHSKWANRVHRKTRQDKKRSALYNKLSRRIMSAAREGGGGDPELNHKLRMAIDQAKAFQLPNDKIEFALKRGTGEIAGISYESAVYEGYGPAGVALMIDTLTDNPVRTVAELRNIMKSANASLGTPGSVAWMFARKGVISVPKDKVDEETIFTIAVEAGAEDVLDEDEAWEVRTDPQDYQAVHDALEAAGIERERAEVTMVPTTTTPVADSEAPKIIRLLDALDEHEDVQHVFANFEISDEALAALDS